MFFEILGNQTQPGNFLDFTTGRKFFGAEKKNYSEQEQSTTKVEGNFARDKLYRCRLRLVLGGISPGSHIRSFGKVELQVPILEVGPQGTTGAFRNVLSNPHRPGALR